LFGPPLRRGAPIRMSTNPFVPNVVILLAGARVDFADAVVCRHDQRRSDLSLLSQYASRARWRAASTSTVPCRRRVERHDDVSDAATYMTLSTMSGLKTSGRARPAPDKTTRAAAA
jgi:hypothetical protein